MAMGQSPRQFGVNDLKGTPVGLTKKAEAPVVIGYLGDGTKFDGRYPLREGPMVITFIRGQWCEDSMNRVEFFKENIAEITELGATVTVISPETMERIPLPDKELDGAFFFIGDVEMRNMKGFDVLFHVHDAYYQSLKKDPGVDIQVENNTITPMLPVMATFIINSDGTMVWSHFDYDPEAKIDMERLLQSIPTGDK